MPALWERELLALLRPPLALVNCSRFLHRELLDFVAARMPAGGTLAVHHFAEGAVSLKSGRAIHPHNPNQCSLREGELARRYARELPQLILDVLEPSRDGARPTCSFAARKLPLLRLCLHDAPRVRLRR